MVLHVKLLRKMIRNTQKQKTQFEDKKPVSESDMVEMLELSDWKFKVKLKVAQLCPTIWDPMDYTVHEILQARILEWVAFPFSRGSSQPRDQTQVSRIAGRFFSCWATREAQEYWSGWPIPSPADIPNPGIKPRSPALQADSLPTEPRGEALIIPSII